MTIEPPADAKGGPNNPPSNMSFKLLPIEPDEVEGSEPFPRRRRHQGQRPWRTKSAGLTSRSLDQQRGNLLDQIKEAGREWPNQPGIKEAARLCLRDDTWTILHWILWRADHGTKGVDASWDLDASLALAELSLELEPDLLLVKDKKDETALHKALSMASDAAREQHEESHLAFARLAKWMCKSAGEAAVKKMLDMTNSLGQTCVHIAVAGQLEIANELVLLSDPETLLRQRRSEQKGGVQNNTALHDAVAYERSIARESRCKEKEPCSRCSEVEHYMWEKRERVLQLVKTLIKKAPGALTMANSENESPYRYHLSTKRQPKTSGNFNGEPKGRTTELAPRQEEDGKFLVHDSTNKPNFKVEELVNGNAWDSLHEAGGAIDPPGLGTRCPKPVWSDKIAEEVEKYLYESAFTLGGFKESCKCFFGKVGDKDYKNPNFRPGHALGIGEQNYYGFLAPPQIMSQVEIIVPVSRPGLQELNPGNTSAEERRAFSNSSRELWEEDMDAVRGVFGMLAKKGVKRILKLTVTDDTDRPCSDEVIVDCIRSFDVRYLDWRKEDLSAHTVLAAAPSVAELWLYSSGRSAILQGWAATDGLCHLHQMTILHLRAPWGFESYEQYIKNIRSFDRDLKRNVAGSRYRRVLHSKMETYKGHIIHQEAQYTWESKELEIIQGHLVRLGEQHKNILAWESNNEQTGNGGVDDTVAELIEEISAYQDDEKDVAESLQDCQNAINRHHTTLEFTAKEWQKLDHGMAQGLNAQVRSMRPLGGNDAKSQGGNPEDETALTFKPSLYPPPLGTSLQDQHHTFFSLSQGQVVANFELKAILDDPPRKKTVDDLEIGLDGFGDREAPAIHRWLESIDQFVSRLPYDGGRAGETDFRVKVALIDDGVDANQDIFRGLINTEGWPVEEPASEHYPFYKSAAGHGTEMAKLIRRVCPKIELYVAKLGEWTDQERVERLGEVSAATNAAKAVQWAIRQRVHIISMSWSLVKVDANKDQIAVLNSTIQEAARRGIIMYCAAADQGQYGSDMELYPARADTEHVKAVGSARENGAPSAFVDSSQVEYFFPGEEIEELGERKGSSAATALASGLAALVLCCFEKQLGKGGSTQIANPKKMHELFEKLKAKDSKWVDATRLFKEGNTVETVVNLCTRWIA